MAITVKADPEPVVIQASLDKPKRRLSFYALPIILVLILLAAIVWWPAPGTTIQDSLVLGAQNDVRATGGATLTGKPAPEQPLKAERPTEHTDPVVSAEPESSDLLNDPGVKKNPADSNTSTVDANANNDAATDLVQSPQRTDGETVQPLDSTLETESNGEASTGSEQTVIEESVIKEITSEDTPSSETAADVSDATSFVADAADVEESIAADVEEESDYEGNTEVAEEAEESESVVTSDLPVISTTATAVSPTPAETISTSDLGEQIIMIGPAASTALSLGEVSEGPNFIPVYQEAGGGPVFSQIPNRQFVTFLGRDESGTWLNVRLVDGTEGWINANQSGVDAPVGSLPAVTEQTTTVATSYPVIRWAHVDTGALNLRSGPGVEYNALSILSQGEIVGLIGRRALGPWVRVRLDSGIEGWLNSSLLAPIN